MARGLTNAGPVSRNANPIRGRGWPLRLAALVLVGALWQPMLPAAADDLDDQQSALQDRIANSNTAISGYSVELDAATAQVSQSRTALADARAVLARAASERDAAAQVDAQKTTELFDAEQALTLAQDAVAAGQQGVATQKTKAVVDMRTTHQQNTAMLSIGMLFVDTADAGDVSSRVQWASTLYNANASEVNRLTEMQLQLQNDQTLMANLEDQARVVREAAAAHLAVTQVAEQAADEAAAKVSELLTANEAAEAAAVKVLADERANNEAMQAEMDAVTQRIQQRNAERAAEAARQAAAAAAAAEAARQAAASAAQQSYSSAASEPAAAAVSSGFPLAMPANGPYTSYFGYRTNPVLGYSELHDGLDIGASCNTAVYAAADGTVIQTVPTASSGGWGNRVVLDNGWVGGVQVSTGYNHMSSYIVSTGQWVSRGQVIGYIGTTGLSTGCHLHFHTWINGQVSDPLNYL